jgi:hypothetical protein
MKVTERVRGDAGYPLPLRTCPRMGAILTAGGLFLAAGVEGPLSTLHFLVIVILSEVRTRSVQTQSKDLLLRVQWQRCGQPQVPPLRLRSGRDDNLWWGVRASGWA